MNPTKKEGILDRLPTDPTRVSLQSFLDLSRVIFHVGSRRISLHHLPEEVRYPMSIRKHTLSYLAKLDILTKDAKNGYYSINEKNEMGLNFLRNLSHNRTHDAYGHLRKLFMTAELYSNLRFFFQSQRTQSVDHLVLYLLQNHPEKLSRSTVERKTRFLCQLLHLIGVTAYDHQNQTITWKDMEEMDQKNGARQCEEPLDQLFHRFHELKAILGFSGQQAFQFVKDLPEPRQLEIFEQLFIERFDQTQSLRNKEVNIKH